MGDPLNEFENVTIRNNAIRKKKRLLSCYYRASSYYIVKYNLRTERVEAQIGQGSYRTGRNYYQWGGNSGMDLAVDEQGLWLLWGSNGNSYRLYASKIDVTRNTITYTWGLSTGKHSFNYRKCYLIRKSVRERQNVVSLIKLQALGQSDKKDCTCLYRSICYIFYKKHININNNNNNDDKDDNDDDILIVMVIII